MNNRRRLWEALREHADRDHEAIQQLLEAIDQFEDNLDENEKDEFEAANLKLPYTATEEAQSEVWK